mgnify:CR=1 FL=1
MSPALAAYSRERVPEGHALLDLSVGPGKEAGPNAVDAFIAAATAVGVGPMDVQVVGDVALDSTSAERVEQGAVLHGDAGDLHGDLEVDVDAHELPVVGLVDVDGAGGGHHIAHVHHRDLGLGGAGAREDPY